MTYNDKRYLYVFNEEKYCKSSFVLYCILYLLTVTVSLKNHNLYRYFLKNNYNNYSVYFRTQFTVH